MLGTSESSNWAKHGNLETSIYSHLLHLWFSVNRCDMVMRLALSNAFLWRYLASASHRGSAQ